ncbi:MAG TPA: RNA polymerase factor sigma-54 [bacterium (Candidatus Stahlbacteria)]|nr:RNA polymerase factor sigma-54 [Candidatus Stahlbacteria bacterium]
MKSELRGELRLILTPKLLHYLTVLQLPILDLIQTLKSEIETNPALEEAEPETEESPEDLNDIFGELDIYVPASHDEEPNILENIPSPPDNLFSHLEKQIKIRFRGNELKIAMTMLYDIDHEGFLHTPEEDLAQHLKVSLDEINKIREKLQTLDPIGCFSYDTVEALRVQLAADGYDPESQEQKILTILAQSETISIDDFDPKIVKHLSCYHPKPGLKISGDLPQYVVPDIIVCWQGDNLIGFLNEDPMPKVRLRREILDILKAPKAFSREEVHFAREKLRSAKNLLTSIAERNQTLFRLTNLLLRSQQDFFKKGKDYLKPLTMKSVAQELNLSISTISRAVSGKYLESPRGIMELKKFFVSGRQPEKKLKIIKRIEELIKTKDKDQTLSDATIARILEGEGLIVSRRTIAKYRLELGFNKKTNRRKD